LLLGNSFLVSTLAKVKSNIDSGVFTAIQETGAYALNNLENIVPSLVKIFRKRRDLVSLELEKLGYQFIKPSATFYLWVKTPKGFSSQEFCKKVLQDVGVVVTPGVGFGKAGEGYFRIALTVEEERLKEAIQRFSTLQL